MNTFKLAKQALYANPEAHKALEALIKTYGREVVNDAVRQIDIRLTFERERRGER